MIKAFKSQNIVKKPNFLFLRSGDCKDEDGVMGRCVAGALNNYTTQLLDYGKQTSQCTNSVFAYLTLKVKVGNLRNQI